MNILAAIRREERKLEKQVGKLQHQVDGLKAAAQGKPSLNATGERTSRPVRQL